MVDIVRLDLPLIRVPNIDYAASLRNADPAAMDDHPTFYPEAPLPVRPGPDFTPTLIIIHLNHTDELNAYFGREHFVNPVLRERWRRFSASA